MLIPIPFLIASLLFLSPSLAHPHQLTPRGRITNFFSSLKGVKTPLTNNGIASDNSIIPVTTENPQLRFWTESDYKGSIDEKKGQMIWFNKCYVFGDYKSFAWNSGKLKLSDKTQPYVFSDTKCKGKGTLIAGGTASGKANVDANKAFMWHIPE